MSIDYERQSNLNMARFFYYELSRLSQGKTINEYELALFRRIGFAVSRPGKKPVISDLGLSILKEVEP